VKVHTWACDVCKKKRFDDANNWHLVFRGSPEIVIRPWHGATPEDIERADYHLCGLACLLQTVNRLCEAPGKTIEGGN
jgi:hypothetical protein